MRRDRIACRVDAKAGLHPVGDHGPDLDDLVAASLGGHLEPRLGARHDIADRHAGLGAAAADGDLDRPPAEPRATVAQLRDGDHLLLALVEPDPGRGAGAAVGRREVTLATSGNGLPAAKTDTRRTWSASVIGLSTVTASGTAAVVEALRQIEMDARGLDARSPASTSTAASTVVAAMAGGRHAQTPAAPPREPARVGSCHRGRPRIAPAGRAPRARQGAHPASVRAGTERGVPDWTR